MIIGMDQIKGILLRTPDVWAVTITARRADIGKYLLLDITRTAQSGRIDRPASPWVGVTIKEWERADNIYHTIDSDWISVSEVDKEIRAQARELEALDVLRVVDDEKKEVRWRYKPYKLWPKSYKELVEKKEKMKRSEKETN